MNIVVLETKNRLINFEDKFKSSFPKSSIVKFGKEDLQLAKERLSVQPLLSANFLVVINCSLKTSKSYISNLGKMDNVNIFVCKDEDIFLHVKELFAASSLDYASTKNVPKESEVLKYIKTKSKLTDDLCQFIYNRCGGYIPMIEENLFIISSLDKVDKLTISKYCRSSNGCNFRHVLYYLLGFKIKYGSNRVFQLIYDYRFGIDSLIKYCLKNTDLILSVYNSIYSGELGWDNYKTFKYPKGVNIYFAKDILTNYQFVSFDSIYYLSNKLNLLSSRDYIGFISLFRR